MLYRFLVFIAFYGLLAQSALNLDEFCHSHLLKTLSEEGTTPKFDKFKKTCEVILPFGDVGGVQAGELCTYYSPFRTIDAKSGPESTTCVYMSKVACPADKDHEVFGKCIRMVYEKSTYADSIKKCEALEGDVLRSTKYTLLKVVDEHMARWVTATKKICLLAFDNVLTGSKGIWINQTSKYESEVNEKLYLNLELDLSKGKQISSILSGTGNEKYFAACEANENGRYPDKIDPAAPKKYFLSNNLYHPSDFLKEDSDGLKEMDAVCKGMNPNSMLAPGKPVGLKAKDPVYVAVRAKPKVKGFTASSQCGVQSATYEHHRNQFNSIIHPVWGEGEVSGVDTADWADKYPKSDCADVARTAVVYSDKKGLMDIPPIGRYRVACVTGKQKGLKVANPCGKGGDLQDDGKCKCKEPDYVDIISMKDSLPEAKNHEELIRRKKNTFNEFVQKGQLCVFKNPCKMVGDKHIIMFLLDASSATHNTWSKNGKSSFKGIKEFVLYAQNMIDSENNEIAFVAYGGRDTKVKALSSGWSPSDFRRAVETILPREVGWDTNCADGFDRATTEIESYSMKRIIIHIGDGIPWGYRRGQADTQRSYENLAAKVDRWISVEVGESDNMKIWHTADDYVDFTNLGGYAGLNFDNMQFLMRKVCPQQAYNTLIESVLN